MKNNETAMQERREFLSRAVSLLGVSLCGGTVAGLLTSCETDTVKSTGAVATVSIAAEPSLQVVGGAMKKTFAGNNGGRPVIIVRTAEESFVVFSSVCTHAGCEISAPRSTDENFMICDLPGCGHGSVFSTTDGSVMAGPAPAPLRSFSNSYNPTDKILTVHF